MERISIFTFVLLIVHTAFAQFDPPAGQAGTKAMYKDSTAFVAWATGCQLKRGYQDISNPSLGYTTSGDSSLVIGKADGMKAVSLGDGGSAIVTFKLPIANATGNDFAVFENGFNATFLELAFVEVSSDGINYFRFPATSNTHDTVQLDNAADMDARRINNLAGKYRASYGTPFDLEELSGISGLDVNRITHVRIVDVVGSILPAYASYDKNGKKINDPWATPFPTGGFDLDAVGIIHQAPPASILEELTSIRCEIFPNPVTSASSIRLELDKTQTITIDVLDLTGRQVAAIATDFQAQLSTTISLENMKLKNGAYVLRVNTAQAVVSKKIVIANE